MIMRIFFRCLLVQTASAGYTFFLDSQYWALCYLYILPGLSTVLRLTTRGCWASCAAEPVGSDVLEAALTLRGVPYCFCDHMIMMSCDVCTRVAAMHVVTQPVNSRIFYKIAYEQAKFLRKQWPNRERDIPGIFMFWIAPQEYHITDAIVVSNSGMPFCQE